jgi:hypothetical protein
VSGLTIGHVYQSLPPNGDKCKPGKFSIRIALHFLNHELSRVVDFVLRHILFSDSVSLCVKSSLVSLETESTKRTFVSIGTNGIVDVSVSTISAGSLKIMCTGTEWVSMSLNPVVSSSPLLPSSDVHYHS